MRALRLALLPAALGLLSGGLAGCVPYAVGTTAATVPERRVEPSGIVQIASGRRDVDAGDGPSGRPSRSPTRPGSGSTRGPTSASG